MYSATSLRTLNLYEKFLAKLLEAAVEDNVQFLEIRANFTKVNKIDSSDQKFLFYRNMT